MSQHIAIIDDDERIVRSLSAYLSGEGYRVSGFATGSAALAALQGQPADLVLLDITLHHSDGRIENGLEVARALRGAAPSTALIIVSGKTDPVERVVGLELGADDYICKPFDSRELLARVRSVLRRAVPPAGPVATAPVAAGTPADPDLPRIGGWAFDRKALCLLSADGGGDVALTRLEAECLAALLAHPRAVLTRQEIVEAIGGPDWVPEDRRIDMIIAKLRKKLGDDPETPRFIATVRGAGYRLIGAG